MRKINRLTAITSAIVLGTTVVVSPGAAAENGNRAQETMETDSCFSEIDDNLITEMTENITSDTEEPSSENAEEEEQGNVEEVAADPDISAEEESQETAQIETEDEEEILNVVESDEAEDELMPALFSGYTYSKTYTGLSVSQVNGVNTSEVLARAISIIAANEGNYASVNKNDNGALSIGYMQWHGARALELMRLIISEDNASAYSILGDSLYNEIINSGTSWNSRTLSDAEGVVFQNLLSTEISRTIQQKLANSDVAVYVNHGIALGIKNGPALVYYADIENQCGYSSTSGSAACAKMAYNLTKDWNKVTLNELHLATVCFIYSGKNSYLAASSSNRTSFLNRRCTTYGTAAGLGWTYCNSGDYLIQYSVNGTEGIKWVQHALNAYQNAGLAVDGSLGTMTKKALITFQASQGLAQSGAANRVTVAALINALYYDVATGASNIVGGYTGLSKDLSTGEWLYYRNGVFDSTMNSVVKNEYGWWYVKNGKVDFTYTGVAKNENGWWRIEAGKVNFGFNGFAQNSNGWWYLTGGKVQFGVNDVIKGTVNQTTGWWYVRGGQVLFTNTVAKNSNGWWYISNGMVDFSHYGVEKNDYGWWRIEAGKVNFDFHGFAENSNGWWYLTGGKVQFDTNDVIKGTVKKTPGWWYVSGGKVIFTDTVAKNSNGWWYISNGMVDFSHYGVEKNSNGWWRIEAGKVNFDFNGFAENVNGWWYLTGGKVQFDTNDVIKGTVKETEGWWYVSGGQVVFTNTVAKNSNGWWYIKNGMVDFSYTGTVKADGVTYSVVNGKVDRE